MYYKEVRVVSEPTWDRSKAMTTWGSCQWERAFWYQMLQAGLQPTKEWQWTGETAMSNFWSLWLMDDTGLVTCLVSWEILEAKEVC